MKNEFQHHDNEEMLLEAAEWFARLQESQLSEEDLLRWERWMAANPKHRKLFSELESVWCKSNTLEDISLPDKSALLSDGYHGDVSVAQWLNQHPADATKTTIQHLPVRRKKFMQLAAAAVIGGIMITTGLWQTGWLSRGTLPEPLYVYQTAEGEHRDIRLSDGSNITLGAQSSLSTSYMQHRRAVVLERGEALFQVAHDTARPFVVIAGSGTITAIGTAFNVRRDTQRVVVTVTEGKVKVARADDVIPSQRDVPGKNNVTSLAQATLIQGQQISYNSEGKLGDIAKANPEEIIAWRGGRLKFRNEQLQYVIDDVNRYTNKKIIIGDLQIEKLVFTGTVFNDQIDDWIDGLAEIFPVRIVKMSHEKILITSAQSYKEAGIEEQ